MATSLDGRAFYIFFFILGYGFELLFSSPWFSIHYSCVRICIHFALLAKHLKWTQSGNVSRWKRCEMIITLCEWRTREKIDCDDARHSFSWVWPINAGRQMSTTNGRKPRNESDEKREWISIFKTFAVRCKARTWPAFITFYVLFNVFWDFIFKLHTRNMNRFSDWTRIKWIFNQKTRNKRILLNRIHFHERSDVVVARLRCQSENESFLVSNIC